MQLWKAVVSLVYNLIDTVITSYLFFIFPLRDKGGLSW